MIKTKLTLNQDILLGAVALGYKTQAAKPDFWDLDPSLATLAVGPYISYLAYVSLRSLICKMVSVTVPTTTDSCGDDLVL